ncbi:threonine dehydratase [Rhodococcus sp. 27YEA15]|uniref:threonine/serine dehydratase n=1 Tax=Rhodococcus sp. 27YEA15 TaxID=3156259 RepID=UPI003C79C690
MLTRSDVLAADVQIREHIRRTPLVQVYGSPQPLWLKCEFMQHTGSFKARGAFNRVFSAKSRGELDPAVGIVAASGGNAGMANAYAAARAGVPATVFVPLTAPPVKVARLREYGALVRQVGNEYVEAFDAAIEYASQTGAVFCHAYDQLEIAAGAGTLAEEILHDEPEIDTVIVSVGGGGLLAGVLAGIDGRAKVVAVEPRTIPTLNAALTAGKPLDVSVSGIAADSLGARRIGNVAFDTASKIAVSSVLVDDVDIDAARTRLWTEYRIAAEHGAATAYAALTSGAYTPTTGERVCVVICGANTDPATLATVPVETALSRR